VVPGRGFELTVKKAVQPVFIGYNMRGVRPITFDEED
jgi:hypothetical protein